MTWSGAQDNVLPVGGCPSETLRLIFSTPTTRPASLGGPRWTASLLPYFANAAPRPIRCASFENERSASPSVAWWRAIAAGSADAATIRSGRIGGIGASDGAADAARV